MSPYLLYFKNIFLCTFASNPLSAGLLLVKFKISKRESRTHDPDTQEYTSFCFWWEPFPLSIASLQRWKHLFMDEWMCLIEIWDRRVYIVLNNTINILNYLNTIIYNISTKPVALSTTVPGKIHIFDTVFDTVRKS